MEEYVYKLEILLFVKGDMVSKEYIYKTLSVTPEMLADMIRFLKEKYQTHAVDVLETHTEVGFITRQEYSDFIDEVDKKETSGELSKSSLETLAVILYKNGATRSDIDYIRGVNSSFILKNLYIRGLIERKEKEGDSRTFVYLPTSDLLRFLGVSSSSQLPDFSELFESLSKKIGKENDDSE